MYSAEAREGTKSTNILANDLIVSPEEIWDQKWLTVAKEKLKSYYLQL